jgi:hypothetical protein
MNAIPGPAARKPSPSINVQAHAALRDRETGMTDAEADKALEELDRLLNDPDVRMDPARVWALAARLSAPVMRDAPVPASR